MSKHTPGPWRLQPRRDVTDEYQCFLEPMGMHIPDVISEADASLIAAAPELLAALTQIAAMPHSNPTGDTLHGPCPKCIAEAAIAKAEGRS